MHKAVLLAGLFALTTTISACDTDAERGVVGAAAGAIISDATGGSKTTGAIIGGVAGVFCDDAGVCK